MSFTVDVLVIDTLNGAVGSWRYNWFGTQFTNAFDQLIGIVSSVSDHVLTTVLSKQGMRLCDVGDVARGQDEVQWIAKCIDEQMNLGTEPAPTAA